MDFGRVARDEKIGEPLVVVLLEGELGILLLSVGVSLAAGVVGAAEVAVLAVRTTHLDTVKAAVPRILEVECQSSDGEAADIIAELDIPDAVKIVVVIAVVEARGENRLVARDSSAAFSVKVGSAARGSGRRERGVKGVIGCDGGGDKLSSSSYFLFPFKSALYANPS